MKRIRELIRPYVLIIFGALLLLFYMNWLSYQGETLAIGIVATILASYYMVVGILDIVLGEKLTAKKWLDVVSVCLFPLFMFVYFLLLTIRTSAFMGPAGWTIAILSMVGSISLAISYLLSKLAPSSALNKITSIFVGVFVLVLLAEVLFDVLGNPIVLGQISILELIIFAFYISFLFATLSRDLQEEVQQIEHKEEPAEEVKESEEEKPEEPSDESSDEPSEEPKEE